MLIVGGCGEPVGGMGKSPVFLLADGGAKWGTIIDVYNPTVPGKVADDYFDITLKSVYKNPTLTSTFADVIVQEYRVTYYRTDGGKVPDPFTISLMFRVSGGGTATINTMIVQRQAKLKSPLRELAFGGGEGNIEMDAIIEFFGEDLMGNKVSTKFVLDITAADS